MGLAGGIGAALADEGRSDQELLEQARQRSKLERVTAEPLIMFPQVLLSCRPPTPEEERRVASPHNNFSVHIYVSPDAVEPIWDLYGEFPEGSFLLKEKFDSQRPDQPELFTGMIKRERGYFPEGGDWEYFTLDGELSQVTSRGKLESCAACHRDFADWDYVSKQYSSVPVQLREYADSNGIGANIIGQGSSGTIYLPASRAETHGKKLSRRDAENEWWRVRPHGGATEAPADLSSLGGPTLRYELEKNKNTLGYWSSADDWASWTVQVRQPGNFEVSMLQGCGDGSGGAEVVVQIGDQELSFVVEETGGFQNFRRREMGMVKIAQPGEYDVTIRARTKPGAAVMDLRQITLRPVDE